MAMKIGDKKFFKVSVVSREDIIFNKDCSEDEALELTEKQMEDIARVMGSKLTESGVYWKLLSEAYKNVIERG